MWFKTFILQIVCDLPKVTELTLELRTLKFSGALSPSVVLGHSHMSLNSHVSGKVSTQSGSGNLPVSKAGREGNHGFTSALAGIPTFCFSFWLKYLQLRNISIGNHAYENKGAEQSGMAICQYFYKQGNICPGNDTFDIDPKIETGNVLL